jgi:hypothetical protein
MKEPALSTRQPISFGTWLRHSLRGWIVITWNCLARPSGSLLRLDAEEILETTDGRMAFSSIPEALSKPFRTDRKLQTGKTGVAAFFGTWPGEETDGELLMALGELRH